MTNNSTFIKSVKAYFLVGIFVSIIAIDFFSTELPHYFQGGEKTALVSVPQIMLPLRNVGKESLGSFPALIMLTAGYRVVQNFELLKKETILESSLQLSSCLWNVFYVFITHQAP